MKAASTQTQTARRGRSLVNTPSCRLGSARGARVVPRFQGSTATQTATITAAPKLPPGSRGNLDITVASPEAMWAAWVECLGVTAARPVVTYTASWSRFAGTEGAQPSEEGQDIIMYRLNDDKLEVTQSPKQGPPKDTAISASSPAFQTAGEALHLSSTARTFVGQGSFVSVPAALPAMDGSDSSPWALSFQFQCPLTTKGSEAPFLGVAFSYDPASGQLLNTQQSVSSAVAHGGSSQQELVQQATAAATQAPPFTRAPASANPLTQNRGVSPFYRRVLPDLESSSLIRFFDDDNGSIMPGPCVLINGIVDTCDMGSLDGEDWEKAFEPPAAKAAASNGPLLKAVMGGCGFLDARAGPDAVEVHHPAFTVESTKGVLATYVRAPASLAPAKEEEQPVVLEAGVVSSDGWLSRWLLIYQSTDGELLLKGATFEKYQ